MTKTKALREQLKTKLAAAALAATDPQETAPGVYYAYAEAHVAAPYLIFSVEEIYREDSRITYELEVNCLDYARDTERCENLADAVTDALDHTVTITDDIEFHIYANRRNNVSSNDEKIVRRRLTFDLYLYERK